MKLKTPVLFCYFKNKFKKNTVCISIFLFLLLANCTKEKVSSTIFISNFKDGETKLVSKEDYWVQKPNEWQIVNNRIECLVSDKNRKIQLLTRQFDSVHDALEMNVYLGVFNNSDSNKDWVGFYIGAQNTHQNKNSTTDFKKGIHIGVCTNGVLFIGAPNSNQKNKTVSTVLKKGVYLHLLIKNNKNGNYTIDFSALEEKNGKVLERISKKDISENLLIGGFSLISNFENEKTNKVNKIKSVWFENWEIKGSKVTKLKG